MSISRYQTATRMSQAVVHGNTVYLAGQVAQDESVFVAETGARQQDCRERRLGDVNGQPGRYQFGGARFDGHGISVQRQQHPQESPRGRRAHHRQRAAVHALLAAGAGETGVHPTFIPRTIPVHTPRDGAALRPAGFDRTSASGTPFGTRSTLTVCLNDVSKSCQKTSAGST